MKRRDRDLLITDALLTIKDYARACHMELERIRVAVEEGSRPTPTVIPDDTCVLCGDYCDEDLPCPTEMEERDCT